MTESETIINEFFPNSGESPNSGKKYLNLGIRFNPFPRSGTTNINGSDSFNKELLPVNNHVKGQIRDFIQSALVENETNPEDKFISATITGDYGSGKTQLLMFVKSLLGEISKTQTFGRNPYVIYIDNPGVKLLELIGAIISKIGEEDLKKFIWNKIQTKINSSSEFKDKLKPFEGRGLALIEDVNQDPYAPENTISYKKFLNSFVRYLNTTKKKKQFEITFKEILLKILDEETKSSTLSFYFYQLISEDFGVNKTWEALSTGSIKSLDKKESEILKYVVTLIKEQGFTDFFILVDEFEDITEGRLSKAQVDNYVHNLRTLLDVHREWGLMFAMTGQALKKLRSISPPLADRISTRLIVLQDLNTNEAKDILLNYLNLAKDENSEDPSPFDQSGITELNDLVEGNARKFLKNCFSMIEKATDSFKSTDRINSEFIKSNFSKDLI